MSLDDWLLALHVVSAFAVVAALVVFWTLTVVARSIDTPDDMLRLGPLQRLAQAAIGVGMGGTLVFGIVLAFSLDDYEPWDGWIVAAIVLWMAVGGLGRQTNEAYAPAAAKAEELRAAGERGSSHELLALNRTSRGLLFQGLTTAVVVLLLLDMIWKPGA